MDKREIFLDDHDKKRFVRLLYLCNGSKSVEYRILKDKPLSDIDMGEKLVAIGAYCLMSNHFHLLIRETVEGGIVKFMSKLLTAHSSYFNKKYGRTGALFGSEFKSSHLNSDEYLKYMFAYIHLNPLKILDSNWKSKAINPVIASQFLDRYNFSSQADYKEKWREEMLILNRAAFPEYFANKGDFEAFLYDWLDYGGEALV
ncbi:transposase [Candidatus Parcubacteria bacterium]|nr:transposase [Candidatus Parcubacteria bacterium]